MISVKELCPFLLVLAVAIGQPFTTEHGPAEEPQPSTSTLSGRALLLQEDEDGEGDVDGADAAVDATATVGTVGTGIVATAINVLTNGGTNAILPDIRPDPNALLDVPRIFAQLFAGRDVAATTPSMVGLGLGVPSRIHAATTNPGVQKTNPIIDLLTSLFRRHTAAGVVAGMNGMNIRNYTSKLSHNYAQETTNSILYGQQAQRQGVLFNQTAEGGIQQPPRQGVVGMNEAVGGGGNDIVVGGAVDLPAFKEQTQIQIVLE